jgi:hypothetical protein
VFGGVAAVDGRAELQMYLAGCLEIVEIVEVVEGHVDEKIRIKNELINIYKKGILPTL